MFIVMAATSMAILIPSEERDLSLLLSQWLALSVIAPNSFILLVKY